MALYQYLDAPAVLEEVQLAERLGYQSVWLGDAQLIWRELWVLLGAAAATTSRVVLGTGVTNPLTRHLAVTASAVVTLQELSRGRARLGIGIGGTATQMLKLPGATRAELATAVQSLRALCAGQTLHGGVADLRLAFGAVEKCPPIVIGGSGAKMLRLAGEVGDGAIIGAGPRRDENVRALVSTVQDGRRAGGRLDQPFVTYLSAPAAVHRDRRKALAAVKPHVAVSLLYPQRTVSEPARRAAEAVREAYHSYDHMSPAASARYAALIPDEVAAEFSIAGTAEECIERAQRIFAAGVDEITIRPYGVDGEPRREAMEAFARDVMSPVLSRY